MKTIKLFTLISMIFFLASCSAFSDKKTGDTIIEDGIMYYEGFVVDIDSNQIIDYDIEYGTDIVLNSDIAGYPVSSILGDAFQNKGITSVEINSSFFIWPEAFANNDIHTIVINCDTLHGAMEFYNNPIENIIFAEGISPTEDLLLSIGISPSIIDNVIFSDGFYISLSTNRIVGYDNSYGLDVTIPNMFDYNVDNQFYITANVDTIGPYAFYKKGLNSISFSSNITTIEKFAFSNNNFTEIDITSTNIKTLGVQAFSYNKLTSFKLNENLVIEGGAFYNNPDLKELTVLNNPDFYLGSYDFIALSIDYNNEEDLELLGVLAERFERMNPPEIHFSDEYTYISQFVHDSYLAEDLDEYGNQYYVQRYYLLFVQYDIDFKEVASFEVDLDDRDIRLRTVIIEDDKIILYIPDNDMFDSDSIPTIILRYELDLNLNVLDFSECDIDTYNDDKLKSTATKNDSLYLTRKMVRVDSNETSSGTKYQYVYNIYNLQLDMLFEYIKPDTIFITEIYPLGDYFYIVGKHTQGDTVNPYFAIWDKTGVVFENTIETDEVDYYKSIMHFSGDTFFIGGIKDDMHFVHEVDFNGNVINEYDVSLRIHLSFTFNQYFNLIDKNTITQVYGSYDSVTNEDKITFSILKLDDSFIIEDIEYSRIDIDSYRSHFVWNNYIYIIVDDKENEQTNVYRIPM